MSHTEPRRCYYVDETMTNAKGHIVPAVVVENESGYHPVDFSWDCTIEVAKDMIATMNKDLGLAPKDVTTIVSSSMPGARR